MKNSSDNFEVVIALNGFSSDIDLDRVFKNDQRLKIIPPETQKINVANNWSRAVKHSSGRFLWLIGDDDFIPNFCLTKTLKFLDKSEYDGFSFNGWSYIFPSKKSGDLGLKREYHFIYKKNYPRDLDTRSKVKIFEEMFKFRPLIPLNMQLNIFSRQLFREIGDEFEMPFPDHIALMKLLSIAKKWRIINLRLCIIGMVSTSFGYNAYFSNNSDGASYLGLQENYTKFKIGNILNFTMLKWLENLAQSNEYFTRFRPSIGNYLLRQLGVTFRQYSSGSINFKEFIGEIIKLNMGEMLSIVLSFFSLSNVKLIFRTISNRPGIDRIIGAKFDSVEYRDISIFAKNLIYDKDLYNA